MLTTMGQGVVLNALIQAGFTPSSHHFDIVHLFRNSSDNPADPRPITVELTTEVDFGNRRGLTYNSRGSEAELLDAFEALPELLCLYSALTQQGSCRLVVTPSFWTNTICFERIDSFTLGTPSRKPPASTYHSLSTKVKIRVCLPPPPNAHAANRLPRIY